MSYCLSDSFAQIYCHFCWLWTETLTETFSRKKMFPQSFTALLASLSSLYFACRLRASGTSSLEFYGHECLLPLCCCCCCCRFSCVQLCATPEMAAHQAPCPWNSPGKNTGVGCHFLLQCMKVKSEREVAQSCLTLSNPMDCSLPGFSFHEVFQARVVEWGAIAFSINGTCCCCF